MYESTRTRIDKAAEAAGILQFELIDQAISFAFKDAAFKAKIKKLAPKFPIRSNSVRAKQQRVSPADKEKARAPKKRATKKKKTTPATKSNEV